MEPVVFYLSHYYQIYNPFAFMPILQKTERCNVFLKCANSIKYFALFLLFLFHFGLQSALACEGSVSSKTLRELEPQYLSIQGGQLEYYRFGCGTPIVLIAGYATDITSWNEKLLSDLAQHHEIIIFNNRNVGGSKVASRHYLSQNLAQDTYQLITQLQLKKPTILGISMGGMIAQKLAVMHPNAIGKLVLINTAISGAQAVHPDSRTKESLLNVPENKLYRYLLSLQLFFPSGERTKMAWEILHHRFRPKSYEEIKIDSVKPYQKELIRDWSNDDKTAKALSELSLPVLLLNGALDTVLPPINSQILFNTIPTATLKVWRKGGHAMIYQYPHEIAASVHDFIVN